MKARKAIDLAYVIILFLCILIVFSPSIISVNKVYATPRNLISGGENYTNQTNIKIPDNILYLLQNLEEAKKILMKYNVTLANRMDKIELSILEGNTEDAVSQYMKFIKDAQNLLNKIKNLNEQDYEKLIQLLPENLNEYDLYSQENKSNYMRVFQTQITPQDLRFLEKLPNLSISQNFFKPNTGSISLFYPSIKGLNSSATLYILFIFVLISALYLTYYYRNRISIFLTRTRIHRSISRMIEKTKYSPSSLEEEVIRIYYSFLNSMEKMGVKKEKYEGPLEFIDKIRDDEIARLGLQISLVFEKVKYGLREPTNDEVKLARENIFKIEGEITK